MQERDEVSHAVELRFIPLKPVMKTIAVLLQPTEVHSGADIHLQTMEDPTPDGPEGVGECLKEAVTPGGGVVASWKEELMLNRSSGKTGDPMEHQQWCSQKIAPCGKDSH